MLVDEPPYHVRFDLERTQSSLYAVGQSISTATAQLLALAGIAALLVFGDSPTNDFELPLVSLRVNQQLAANMMIALTAVWGFRVKSLEFTQRILRRKLGAIVDANDLPLAG